MDDLCIKEPRRKQSSGSMEPLRHSKQNITQGQVQGRNRDTDKEN